MMVLGPWSLVIGPRSGDVRELSALREGSGSRPYVGVELYAAAGSISTPSGHPIHCSALDSGGLVAVNVSEQSHGVGFPRFEREVDVTRLSALVRYGRIIGILSVGIATGSFGIEFLDAQQQQPAGRGQAAPTEPPAPCGPKGHAAGQPVDGTSTRSRAASRFACTRSIRAATASASSKAASTNCISASARRKSSCS